MCPYGAGRGPAGSGGKRVYITQSGINTPHNPSNDILHSPGYEDGTDSEFRNIGN